MHEDAISLHTLGALHQISDQTTSMLLMPKSSGRPTKKSLREFGSEN